MCHMIVDRARHLVPGISGVVEDGILPNLFGYEAGRAWAISSSGSQNTRHPPSTKNVPRNAGLRCTGYSKKKRQSKRQVLRA